MDSVLFTSLTLAVQSGKACKSKTKILVNDDDGVVGIWILNTQYKRYNSNAKEPNKEQGSALRYQ